MPERAVPVSSAAAGLMSALGLRLEACRAVRLTQDIVVLCPPCEELVLDPVIEDQIDECPGAVVDACGLCDDQYTRRLRLGRSNSPVERCRFLPRSAAS